MNFQQTAGHHLPQLQDEFPQLQRVGRCLKQRLTEPYPKTIKPSRGTFTDAVQWILKGLYINSEQGEIFQSYEIVICSLFKDPFHSVP